jgi:hypothetical protein
MSEKQWADASFFTLVHDVLAVERQRELQCRREGRRSPYRCLQLIAPLYYQQMPPPSHFRRMQCVDLSPGGLAYLSDEPPPTDRIVVALGDDPVVLLVARVTRHEREYRDGRSIFRVACRFTGRLRNDDQSAAEFESLARDA